MTRGFPCLEHTRPSPIPVPIPQTTRPCRSDVFVSHQASLSRSPSFQRKGFRSQVKQMSGDDRIRARQARNFFARPDTSRATDTADMTRARRRQRSPRSWHCGSGREAKFQCHIAFKFIATNWMPNHASFVQDVKGNIGLYSRRHHVGRTFSLNVSFDRGYVPGNLRSNEELPFGGISGCPLHFKASKVPPTAGSVQVFPVDALELCRP